MSEDDKALYAMLSKVLEYLQLASEQLIIHRAYAGDKARMSDDLLIQINKASAECADVLVKYQQAYMK